MAQYRKAATFIFIYFFGLLIVGCSNTIPPQETNENLVSTDKGSIALTLTSSPIPINTALSTTEMPTPTIRPIISKSATPTAMVIEKPEISMWCLQYQDDNYPKLDGKIVLSSPEMGNPARLLDPQTGNFSVIGPTTISDSCPFCPSDLAISDMTVSPDNLHLAYYDVEQETILVQDLDGNLVLELPSPARKLSLAYWLDHQNLILNNRLVGYDHLGALLIINPFTGKQEEWLPDYQNRNREQYYPWKVKSALVVNPQRQQVIFPVGDDEPWPIVLWDIQSNRELARVYGGSVSDQPEWSPNGEYFVTEAAPIIEWGDEVYFNSADGLPHFLGSELFLVSKAGDIKRLTYFTINSAANQLLPVWSPDGQKIAFLMYDPLASQTLDLMILDLETNQIMNYCSTSNLFEMDYGDLFTPPEPIWSPDGEYLLVTQIDGEWNHNVYLVELQSSKIWLVAENAIAEGWMIGLP